MARTKQSTLAGAFALVAMLAIGGLIGCGGESGAAMTKADAVVVTYYYLPL
ncbi:MAG: hypothetical protein AABZ94_09560 [Candidatus Eisenbacteria bacterium]